MRAGGSEEVAWLQICEPTEKDKGKYTFEIFDGKENHQRSLDLSGAGEPALCRPQGPRSVTELERGGRGGGSDPAVLTQRKLFLESQFIHLATCQFSLSKFGSE